MIRRLPVQVNVELSMLVLLLLIVTELLETWCVMLCT